MKKHRIMLMTAALLASQAMWAQQKNLSGTVVDSQGEPIIGATVKVPGSATGAITDLDGHFSITVNPGTKLEVSYVGMQTVSLTAGDNMHVILKDDSKTLNDVVVIGYGVQKKSVVTASIAKVDAEDLQGKTQLRAEDALKGLAAGVNVTSASGQPGSKSMIRVRGIGTINNSDPLYIIDGMATDQNGMELVNPEDIESIEVLKDAASGAIYGSRAANGVILVTTKKGVKGNAKINYNFSYGWQNAWRKRDVTGATDYAILQNEKYVNGGQAPLYADPYNLTDVNGNAVTGFGTNWQKELFNDNAPIVQHDLSISGASDKVNYYLSMGYMKQEGIVGGNYGQSNYDRLTLRSNTNYTLFDASKDRKYLNKLDLGVNVGYMRVHNTGIDANSTWGSPLGSALYLSPILPVTITKPDVATAMEKQYSAYELYKPEFGIS
jgi:TonB-linked SusC/RagA family outer membrane protein